MSFLKPQKYAHKIIPRISNIDITKKILRKEGKKLEIKIFLPLVPFSNKKKMKKIIELKNKFA